MNTYAMSRPDAAYAFALVGGCARQEPQLLAANELLQATRPIFAVTALVTPVCWSEPVLNRMRRRSIAPILINATSRSQVNCTGSFRGPAEHFVLTYAILNMFTLTQFAAILYLDTDLAILSNLDHLLLRLLSMPPHAQIWTPQQCKSLTGAAAVSFNTGVWGVKPDLRIHRELMDYVASGSSKHICSEFLIQSSGLQVSGTDT